MFHSIKKTEFSASPTKHTGMINENYVRDSINGASGIQTHSENMRGTLQCSFSGKKAYGNGYSASKIIEATNSNELDPEINAYNPN